MYEDLISQISALDPLLRDYVEACELRWKDHTKSIRRPRVDASWQARYMLGTYVPSTSRTNLHGVGQIFVYAGHDERSGTLFRLSL